MEHSLAFMAKQPEDLIMLTYHSRVCLKHTWKRIQERKKIQLRGVRTITTFVYCMQITLNTFGEISEVEEVVRLGWSRK